MIRRSGRAGKERRGEPASLLVVGLGNPGARFEGTRHNVGAEAVALLAERHSGSLRKSRELARVAEVRIRGERVALAVPQTFMNESGQAVARLVHRHGIDEPTKIVIVHDELDLPVGELRVKSGGGLAGHNGLRSVTAHLKTQDYLRVRIGVGKPPGRQSGADHVLRRPGAAEATELEVVAREAADAVEVILAEGVDEAMSRFNSRS
ncbi:MAG: aminoacyl-tRNA hydrolase [Acidimicrobiaceae bacterium]|jgi:PTH1 family peptidyl-tRNA hydrolase|nr:aminoacyl-tRNA hydrolase [Acidimicrobiaceae bacterium]MDP6480549.1 aminoacyl-tRNA hydrolase [Acidimicrobiales bacterium]MDP6697324.1 aminoacyl-tRNA hydrolase [Acidimicrobiales bacterium]|tara:strand:+ start:2319 stop:2939 length:621 start_codon:yes stop_codon:yes gene_type:complete